MTLSARIAAACVALLIAHGVVCADAIVRTQAMLASTIAEYSIEDERVMVALEISPEDLPAFRNLLPDEIYVKLGHAPRPLAERWVEFFQRDLVITTGKGRPLMGRVLEMEPRPRVKRDDVTGEPLPIDEEEAETIIYARLEYPLPQRPERLTLGGTIATRTAMGFVAYHGSVAVNDFRYLGPSQTLELDWEDPWYTRFQSRSLRRAFFSAMSGFIYVEPYEVRKEIIVRPKDLQHWIDLGLTGRETLPVEMQGSLKRSVAEFLRERQPVTIDGRTVTPDLARINFLERTLKTSRVIDPPEELDLDSAVLGLIFVYPTDGLPERVTMEWDLFNEKIQVIAAAAVDPVGPLPSYLEPDSAVLEWQNFIKIPVMPTMMDVRAPPSTPARWAFYLRWPLAALSALLVWRSLLGFKRRRAWRGAVAGVSVLSLALTGGGFWLSRDARLSDSATREVVGGLLHNIYRAFDYREEEQIYDVLARSVDGDLLTRIYLETRRGLELANQGGARAKVKEVELIDLAARRVDGGGLVATTTWTVSGSVGHWGHVHQRRNRYQAELEIQPTEGAWRLTGLTILQEERL